MLNIDPQKIQLLELFLYPCTSCTTTAGPATPQFSLSPTQHLSYSRNNYRTNVPQHVLFMDDPTSKSLEDSVHPNMCQSLEKNVV